MAIRKRGSKWQVRYKPFPDQTLDTKEAALMVERDLRRRKQLGELYVEKPTTFGAELDAHEARKKAMGGKKGKLRPATVEFNANTKKGWAPLRDVLIPNLRRSLVEDHISVRAAKAPVAARNELQLAKAALHAAESRGQRVDRGIFDIQPVHHETQEGRALELAELHAIAAQMPEYIRRIVPFCGTVGLRWSEAVNLAESMLDLDKATLSIPQDLNKSRRAKPIELAAVEVRLLREQMMARTPATTLMFPNARGGVYSKSGFRSVWTPALKRAGQDGFKFHWLRHTAISVMCRAGLSPELIARRVDHKDGGALIYRRYRHLYEGEMQAAVELIDAFVVVSERSEAAGSGS